MPPRISGIHHISVPVAEPQRAADWYAQVFGFAVVVIEERAEDVALVVMNHPSGIRLVLHNAGEIPARSEYPLCSLLVGRRADLRAWDDYLTELGIDHTDPREAHLGWALTLVDPDGVRIQLHTDDSPSGDDS